jgi:hypothetical protein
MLLIGCFYLILESTQIRWRCLLGILCGTLHLACGLESVDLLGGKYRVDLSYFCLCHGTVSILLAVLLYYCGGNFQCDCAVLCTHFLDVYKQSQHHVSFLKVWFVFIFVLRKFMNKSMAHEDLFGNSLLDEMQTWNGVFL